MKPIDKLISLLKEDRVIPVIGAGVSYAAAALPGWKGFVERGLEYADNRKLALGSEIEDAKKLLEKGDITQGANIMKRILNAPGHPFADWLDDFLSNPKIISDELLNSINNLCTPIILTTNYDNLLYSTTKIKTKKVLDWSQHEETAIALKKKKEILLHLHGVYDRPKTIILSSDDYKLLNTNLGYKSNLRELWTNYHFLFIGCSKDGVMDEDFSTVVDFLNEWFPGVPNEHFILLHENDIAKGIQVELARTCNIAAICYGNDYAIMPTFINGFNPNWQKLSNKTKELQDELKKQFERQLIESSGKITMSVSKINAFLKNELPHGIYWIDSVQFTFLEKIWNDYNNQINSKSEKFSDYQNLIKGLVSLSDLESKINFWNKNSDNPSVLNSKTFIELAILAYECLNKFPKDMLEDIRHRRPYTIHPYYFTGYLGGFIQRYKKIRELDFFDINDIYSDDKYFFENLKRVLTSLNGLLEIKTTDLYNEIEPAIITPEIIPPFLVFVSGKEITIRNSSTFLLFAKLPAEKTLPFKGAQLIKYNDNFIIIGYTSKNCFYWNPKENLTAINFFEVQLMADVTQVISTIENNNIETQIFCENVLMLHINFRKQEEIHFYSGLGQFIYFPQKSCWVSKRSEYKMDSEHLLFRIEKDSNTQVPILSIEDLFRLVKNIPPLNIKLIESLKINRQVSDLVANINPPASLISIKPAQWGNKGIFLLSCKTYIEGLDSTMIFGFDLEDDMVSVLFRISLVGKSCITYDLVNDGNDINLVCGYLARAKDNPTKLVQYFRAINLNDDIVAEENDDSIINSDGNARNDILSVCALPDNYAFAMQDDKIFKIDFKKLNFSDFATDSYVKKIIPVMN